MSRGILLAALLAGEALLTAVTLDLRTALERACSVAASASAQAILVLGLLAALAVVLFGAGEIRVDLQRWLGRLRQAQRSPRLIILHIVCFLAFLGLSVVVAPLEFPGEPGGSQQWLGALWALAAVPVLGFWAANAMPQRLHDALMKNGFDLVLAGLAVAAPAVVVARLTRFLWQPLGATTLWAVHDVLSLLYPEVVYRPEAAAVGTPSCRVIVSVACGGYEGIGLNFIFLAAYLLMFRRELRWPAVLLLLPVGAVLMWLANIARIVALIAIGDGISTEVALKGFHSQAGWLIFAAVTLGMISVSRALPFFTAAPATAAARFDPVERDAPAYLAPFLALLATMMLTRAFSGGFDVFYPLRVLATALVLLCFRAEYLKWSWRPCWQAAALGVAMFVLWIGLALRTDNRDAGLALRGSLESLPPLWRHVWIAFRVIGSVVTVPIAEELAFRGYLTRRLLGADADEAALGKFSWFSFVVSSLLFGLLHGRWLAGTLAGMGYALALYRRRSLADAILAHAVTNALIAALVLVDGRWSLWV